MGVSEAVRRWEWTRVLENLRVSKAVHEWLCAVLEVLRIAKGAGGVVHDFVHDLDSKQRLVESSFDKIKSLRIRIRGWCSPRTPAHAVT